MTPVNISNKRYKTQPILASINDIDRRDAPIAPPNNVNVV